MNGRLTWLPAALTNAGLRVNVVGGWETRGRPTMHARGLIWHHTASRAGSNAPSLRVVIDGRPDLPGTLILGAINGNAEPFLGDIGAFLLYNRVLTGTELGQVEAYLADRYGITI